MLCPHLGGAKVEFGSYVGDGQFGSSHPNTLTFSFTPKMWGVYARFVPFGQTEMPDSIYSYVYTFPWGVEAMPQTPTDNNVTVFSDQKISYSGNTVTYYGISANNQMNDEEINYYYFAIGE